MSLKDSKTEQNLKDAFAGESQANRRYLYFAAKADVEGYNDVAAVFRSTAEGETGHAHGHLEYLEETGDPATGLPMVDINMTWLAVVGLLIGQPDNDRRWQMIEAEQGALLAQRTVQIEPAELLSLMHDSMIKVVMIDVRDERHYNQFHIHDAELIAMDELVRNS